MPVPPSSTPQPFAGGHWPGGDRNQALTYWAWTWSPVKLGPSPKSQTFRPNFSAHGSRNGRPFQFLRSSSFSIYTTQLRNPNPPLVAAAAVVYFFVMWVFGFRSAVFLCFFFLFSFGLSPSMVGCDDEVHTPDQSSLMAI